MVPQHTVRVYGMMRPSKRVMNVLVCCHSADRRAPKAGGRGGGNPRRRPRRWEHPAYIPVDSTELRWLEVMAAGGKGVIGSWLSTCWPLSLQQSRTSATSRGGFSDSGRGPLDLDRRPRGGVSAPVLPARLTPGSLRRLALTPTRPLSAMRKQFGGHEGMKKTANRRLPSTRQRWRAAGAGSGRLRSIEVPLGPRY